MVLPGRSSSRVEALGVEIRQFEEEALARRQRDSPINIEPFTDVRHRADRLHATGRGAPSADREQAKAAFVLAEYAQRACIHGRHDALELLTTGRLERLDRLRVFLCDWAAAP
jgi:hypothetical protein